jgi:hypothetical protein
MRERKQKPVTRTRRIYVWQSLKIDMTRRIEVWRPVSSLTPAELKRAFMVAVVEGERKALIDVDEKLMEDLLTDVGLNALCGQAFDSSGSRPAVFNYCAIGTSSQTPANGDTALIAESMRVQGTYTKDGATGECSMDATFNIVATLALQECGLLNAASVGIIYCRDTYAVKNVVSGDTVKVYYTPKHQR